MRQTVQDARSSLLGRQSHAGEPTARKFSMLGIAAVVGLLGVAAQAQAQTTFSAETQRHTKASVKNGGGDVTIHTYIRNYACAEYEDQNVFNRWSAERRTFRIPLLQIFDDLWFVGDAYVGQYILKTPQGGFILIDTLNNSAEVDTYTIPALKQLGWTGPSTPVHAALITHGHGDHDGGANRLRALFPGIEIYIGSGDARGKAYNPIQLNSANLEPDERTIGGVKIVFQSMPGHTAGATSFIVPVHQDGVQHNIWQGGRNGSPNSVSGSIDYLRSTERAYWLLKKYNAQGTFHVHPNSDGSNARFEHIQRHGRSPNPFLIGNERTTRAAAVWRDCAAGWLGTRDATASEKVWRVTTLKLPELAPQANTITAQLSSGWGVTDPDRNRTTPDTQWGPIAGQTVSFNVDGAAVCTAVTNTTGTASCTLPNGGKLLPNQKVTATFDGETTATFINLPSTGSGVVPVRVKR